MGSLARAALASKAIPRHQAAAPTAVIAPHIATAAAVPHQPDHAAKA
ncbi:hypothetical protein [Streptomyces sp. BA2]|nr:hypothetical protein [Streptomyces sp. BA2]MWA14368.1 hypothetical protein [Streptomyces sp. BA2]